MKKKYLVIRSQRDIAKIKKIIKRNRELRKKAIKKYGKRTKIKPKIRLEYY